MYPYLRLGLILATTKVEPDLPFDAPTTLRLTCSPFDVDIFGEMNNGRHLTLFDLGRLHHAKKVGFLRILPRKKWGLVVGGSSVQYRRRIYPFQRFTLHTRLVGFDDKWIYFQQSTLIGETVCSSAVVRTAVVAGPRGTVPTADVVEAVGGLRGLDGATPDWVRAWAEADRMRPWPPALERPTQAAEPTTS